MTVWQRRPRAGAAVAGATNLDGPSGRSDQRAGWSLTGRVLHWLSAALILFLMALGFAMVEWVADPAARFDLYQLHKTWGMVALLLTVVRALWRLGATAPLPPPTMTTAELLISRVVHLALYCGMVALAMTGYAMISASPLPLPATLPGGLTVPNLIAPDFALSEQMKALHHDLAWLMLGLVGLHVAAALKHHFIDGDDVLRGMLVRRRQR